MNIINSLARAKFCTSENVYTVRAEVRAGKQYLGQNLYSQLLMWDRMD